MARYELILRHPNGEVSVGEPPSATEIIKGVFGAAFAPAAGWGFKLGLRAAFPDMPDDEFVQALAEAYASEHSPNKVRDSAAERGISTHRFFEALANGEPEVPPSTPYEESVLKWWNSEMDGWKVVATEVPLISLKHNFVGTVDLIRYKTRPLEMYEVCDLKTHKGSARTEDWLQVAAYELAAREMGLIDGLVNHRIILAREDGKKAGQSTKWTKPEAFLAVKAVFDLTRGGS
jgi:hypothetical protein